MSDVLTNTATRLTTSINYQGENFKQIEDNAGLIGRSFPYGNNVPVCWSVQYELTTPAQDNNNTNITSLTVSQLSFEIDSMKNGNYALTYKVGAGGDGNIYGLFSKNEKEPYSELLNSNSFIIKTYQSPFNSKELVVKLDNPISLEIGQPYYLYLFTKELNKTVAYKWPTNKVQDTLTITYNYETYTKFQDPTGELEKNMEIVAPSQSISVRVSLPDDIVVDLLDKVEISWEGAKKGNAIIEPENGACIYSLNLENAIRGQQLKVHAQLKHLGGQEYDSNKVFIGQATINSLPSVSSINFNEITISSQHQSEVDITVEGSDNDDSQSLEYYWKSGNMQNFSRLEGSVTIQNGQIFYIYAKDGLENGEVLSYKIETNSSIGLKVNTPPQLEKFEYEYNMETNDIAIIEYEGNIPNQLRLSYKGVNGEWVETGATEGAIPLTELLRGIKGPFEYLQIDGKIVDELGDESEVFSHFFQPSIIKLTSDGNSLSRHHFDLSQEWRYELDSREQENFEIVAEYEQETLDGNPTLTSYYLFINNINILKPKETYKIKAITQWPDSESAWTDIWLTELQITVGNFARFLKGPAFDFSIYNPFQAWLNNDNETSQGSISVTDISSIPKEKIKLIVTNKDLNLKKEKDLTYFEGSSNDTLICEFNNKDLYSWPENTPVKGIHPFEIAIGYQADSDTFIQSPTTSINYDFNYIIPAPLPSFSSPIKEGDIPSIELKGLQIATQATLSLELQVDRDDGKGFVNYGSVSFSMPEDLKKPSIKNNGLKLPTIEEENTITFPPIGEITNTHERVWRVVTKIADQPQYYDYLDSIPISVIQHTAPTNFVITNSTWRSTDAVLDFTINKNSNDEELKIDYALEKGGDLGGIVPEGNQLIFTPNESKGGPYEISVKVQTTLNGRVKEAISNIFIIYVEGPTISYRAHHIGINSSVLDEDNVLTISPGSDRRRFIYLKGASSEIKINLSDGSIMGAILDCGSWDNTPGGIIPGGGGGSAPEGLAQVAYTGNIADLVQTPGTEIIIGDID